MYARRHVSAEHEGARDAASKARRELTHAPHSAPRRSDGFTLAETDELYLLVAQAWELREHGSPYLLDACQAIVDWYERRRQARLEREREQDARIVRLLREASTRAEASR